MEIRQDSFTVKTYHCQPDGCIKISSLMNCLQEAAAAHAEQLGFGMQKLNEIESYWVLSNIKIEFQRFPKWNEQIKIKTWPSGHTRSVATRDFIGEDENGSVLFEAGTEWMILKKTTNRPRNLLKTGLDIVPTGPQTISANLERLAPPEDCTLTDQLKVPYSSIDLNNHVNNTEYVRWAIDAARKKFNFAGPVASIQATYFAEVFEGDQIDLLTKQDTPGHLRILARKTKDKTNVCTTLIQK